MTAVTFKVLPVPEKSRAVLFLTTDGTQGEAAVPVDPAWRLIGRGRWASSILAEPTISRAHAAIGFDGKEFFVQDLGSTNGTWVNGKRGRRAALRDGDGVQLGKLKLSVTLPD